MCVSGYVALLSGGQANAKKLLNRVVSLIIPVVAMIAPPTIGWLMRKQELVSFVFLRDMR